MLPTNWHSARQTEPGHRHSALWDARRGCRPGPTEACLNWMLVTGWRHHHKLLSQGLIAFYAQCLALNDDVILKYNNKDDVFSYDSYHESDWCQCCDYMPTECLTQWQHHQLSIQIAVHHPLFIFLFNFWPTNSTVVQHSHHTVGHFCLSNMIPWKHFDPHFLTPPCSLQTFCSLLNMADLYPEELNGLIK